MRYTTKCVWPAELHGVVGPRAGLGKTAVASILTPARSQTPVSSSQQPCHCTGWAIPVPYFDGQCTEHSKTLSSPACMENGMF